MSAPFSLALSLSVPGSEPDADSTGVLALDFRAGSDLETLGTVVSVRSHFAPDDFDAFLDGVRYGVLHLPEILALGRGLPTAMPVADAPTELERAAVDAGLVSDLDMARELTGGLDVADAAAVRREWATAGFPACTGIDAMRRLLRAGNVLCIARDLGHIDDAALLPFWPPTDPPPARRTPDAG